MYLPIVFTSRLWLSIDETNKLIFFHSEWDHLQDNVGVLTPQLDECAGLSGGEEGGVTAGLGGGLEDGFLYQANIIEWLLAVKTIVEL